MSLTILQRVAVTAIAMTMVACAGPKPLEEVPEVAPGFLRGYLASDALPNSLLLLMPPPAVGTPEFAADEAIYHGTRKFRGTPRWDLAVQDADLRFPGVTGTFSCAVNAPLTPEVTPRLYRLLQRSATDAGRAMNAAKDHYNRRRPFNEYSHQSCTPASEPALSRNGSFPSGHTGIGWAWGLILAELAPSESNAILARGYAFGQSRVICGVHWQSDVNEGRVVAAGVVARLHADPVFMEDFAEAKKELDAAHEKGLKPTRDCEAERAALAIHR